MKVKNLILIVAGIISFLLLFSFGISFDLGDSASACSAPVIGFRSADYVSPNRQFVPFNGYAGDLFEKNIRRTAYSAPTLGRGGRYDIMGRDEDHVSHSASSSFMGQTADYGRHGSCSSSEVAQLAFVSYPSVVHHNPSADEGMIIETGGMQKAWPTLPGDPAGNAPLGDMFVPMMLLSALWALRLFFKR